MAIWNGQVWALIVNEWITGVSFLLDAQKDDAVQELCPGCMQKEKKNICCSSESEIPGS